MRAKIKICCWGKRYDWTHLFVIWCCCNFVVQQVASVCRVWPFNIHMAAGHTDFHLCSEWTYVQSVVCVRKMCAEAFCIQQYLCEGLSLPLTSDSLTTLCGVTLFDHWVGKVWTQGTWSQTHHVFDDASLDSKTTTTNKQKILPWLIVSHLSLSHWWPKRGLWLWPSGLKRLMNQGQWCYSWLHTFLS